MTEPKPKRNNRKIEDTLPSEGEIAILAERDEPTVSLRLSATALWQRPKEHQLLISVEGRYYLYPAANWNGLHVFELDMGELSALPQPEDWAQLFPDAPQLIRDAFYMTGVVRRTDLDKEKLRYGLQRLVSTLAQRFSEYKE